jgi:histidine ammonia-lyase
MTGIAALALLRAERLLAAADVIGAFSIEAFLGNRSRLRPAHQRAAAASGTSARRRSFARAAGRFGDHAIAPRLRARAGSVLVPLHSRSSTARRATRPRTCARVLEIEAISVTDNPLIFPDDDEFLTGGNFHGQPVGVVCDFLKAVMVEVASDQRAPLVPAAQRRGTRLPLFSRASPGPRIGPDDRSVHRGRAREREQRARAPLERRFDSRPRPVRKITSRWARSPRARSIESSTTSKARCAVLRIAVRARARPIEFRRPLCAAARSLRQANFAVKYAARASLPVTVNVRCAFLRPFTLPASVKSSTCDPNVTSKGPLIFFPL